MFTIIFLFLFSSKRSPTEGSRGKKKGRTEGQISVFQKNKENP